MSNVTCLSEASDLNEFCLVITSNPDISGKGVRIAIYAQTIISMVIASVLRDNEKAFKDTTRNSYVVSFSLIVASVVTWKRDGLSLFDGLVVTMLTTMMTSFVLVNSTYMRTLGLSSSIASFLFVTLWCYWGLQIWAEPWNFGLPAGRSGCTANEQTIFVVFGHNVEATNQGLRGFAIFVFATSILYAAVMFRLTLWWLIMYLAGRASVSKDDEAYRLATRIQDENIGQHISHISRFGGVGGVIYMIVTTEQMIARNQISENELNNWTFGQTIALVLLAQQILDCFRYIKASVSKRSARVRRAAARSSGNPSGV